MGDIANIYENKLGKTQQKRWDEGHTRGYNDAVVDLERENITREYALKVKQTIDIDDYIDLKVNDTFEHNNLTYRVACVSKDDADKTLYFRSDISDKMGDGCITYSEIPFKDIRKSGSLLKYITGK